MGVKNNESRILKIKAGFLIILVSVITFSFTILSGGIYFLNFDYSQIFTTKTISSNDKNAQVSLINEDEIFEKYYYAALDILSNTVASGTTWLDLCSDSQTFIDGQIYIQVCSDKYFSIKSIKTDLTKYISSDLINVYMADNYKEYNNSLYVLPFNIKKDETYAGLSSYTVKNKTTNRIEYNVTSKYSGVDCNDECKYTYKKQNFVLEKQKGNWIVTVMELPY